jgi:hypothetical protein
MFDRYLWPLVLVGAALLLIRPASVAEATDEAAEPEAGEPGEPEAVEPAPRPRRFRPAPWLAVGLVTVFGFLSVMNLLASNAFSAGRWAFADRAVAMGIPAGHVDGGMEWVGYYARGDATVFAGAPKGQMWYTGWWPSFRLCGLVTSSQVTRPGYEIVFADPSAYRQFQVAGPPLPLYLYRVNTPSCP